MTTTPLSTEDSYRTVVGSRADNLQVVLLVLIVLGVGTMAGAASFHHVHDFTMHNSPTGTADWFGWANAVITELIPIATLIDITRRRRKHRGAPIRYPVALLVAAMSVSLTAQLAVARPTVFGWLVSALPALAFFALSKLVFTATAPPRPVPDPVAATVPATSPATSSDTTRVEVRPAAAPTTRATTPATKRTPATKTTAKRTPAKKTTAPATAKTTPAAPATVRAPAAAASAQRFPDPLLTNARTIAASHRHEHGQPINPNQLAVRLRVPTNDAADILTHLETHPPIPATTKPHNGSRIGATA